MALDQRGRRREAHRPLRGPAIHGPAQLGLGDLRCRVAGDRRERGACRRGAGVVAPGLVSGL